MEKRLSKQLRVAVLWTRLSGYLNACLHQLVAEENAALFVSFARASQDAPYDANQFAWMKEAVSWTGEPDEPTLVGKLESFNPEILIVSGWHVRAYRNIAKRWKGRCLRIMTMDNCWHGTAKQFLGSIFSPQFVRPIADCVWLPGERQAVFARMLGFPEESIMRGLYTCDQSALATVYRQRIDSSCSVPNAFIYVGRFVPQKGINTLVEAYQNYRKQASQPWPLYCYGDGPQKHLLRSVDGVHLKGFCQPEQLPSALSQAGCLILPSHFEPWAVVIHEAASAGLVLLASNAVGSAVHLVQPGYNGYIFDSHTPQALAALMLKISSMPHQKLEQMSHASHALSHQFTPELWVQKLVESHDSWAGLHQEIHKDRTQAIA